MTTSAQTPRALRPKRRWATFTTRGALLALTLFCVWLGVVSHRARRQAKAIARIQELHGTLEFEPQSPKIRASSNRSKEPKTPWYERLFGKELFRRVVAVELSNKGSSSWGDDDLIVLCDLPDLKRLSLKNPKLTDQGLSHLVDLNRLEWLHIVSNQIDGSGLRHLSRMLQLKQLDLIDTKITDEALLQLPDFPQIEHLDLSGSWTSDESLSLLVKRQTLRILNLDQTALSDAGLRKLAALKQLDGVFISKTFVTPIGVDRFCLAAPNCTIVDDVSWDPDIGVDLRGPPGPFSTDATDMSPEPGEVVRHIKEYFGFSIQGPVETFDLSAPTLAGDYLFPNGILTEITPESVRERLARFTPIISFTLRRNHVDKELCALLRYLPDIKELEFDGVIVSDDVMAEIGKRSTLVKLSLNGARLTDRGVRELQNLKQLQGLWLNDTRVSDASLPVFLELPALKWLSLNRTRCTPAGVAKLRKQLPECNIVADEPEAQQPPVGGAPR